MQGDQLMVRGDYTGAYNAYTEVALGPGWKGCRWGVGHFFKDLGGRREPLLMMSLSFEYAALLYIYIYLHIYLHISTYIYLHISKYIYSYI